MPINAFGGGPGTGKTYGVMEHVIIPAIAKGRFVITNIDGLQDEAIYQYVNDTCYKGKIFCIGHIRHCDRAAPEREDFFPGQDSLDKAMSVPSPDSPCVVGGDLVVIDEATRYWSVGEKVSTQDSYFFREHRHFVNEMGHTCDLVVIDPDITMLARALKGKIEMTSLTHKPKELGLERYVVQIFNRAKLTGKPVSVGGPYPFKKEIYSLYRSYAVAGAKEQAIDSRQSLVKVLLRKFGLMAFLGLACIVGFVLLLRHKMAKMEEQGRPAAASVQGAGSSRPSLGQSSPVAPPAGSSPSVTRSAVSPVLRVVGRVVLRGEPWVVLADGALVRLENPAAFVGRGSLVVGQVEGQRVTTWSGRSAEKQDGAK
jgi:zona occludens toxin